MPDTLTITDNRTGRTIEVPIEDGAIRANALRQLKLDDADFGLMSYDPAFLNTASCHERRSPSSTATPGSSATAATRSSSSPIESTYLETAYLLLFGELPTEDQLMRFEHDVTYHTFLHENLKTLMEGFRYDAHPMGMFVSVVAPSARSIRRRRRSTIPTSACSRRSA